MSKAKYIAKSVDSSGNLAIAIADGSVGVYANTGISNAASASLYANTAIANAASASLYANTGISTATQTALNLKANQSTTYTKTEADAAISNLVAAAPGALDTLNELATALGNDPNFATTVTNSIALKSPLASPTLTGTATASNLAYTGTLTGSTGILNIGSGQVYKDASGNVGIGTSFPVAKVNINLTPTASLAAAAIVKVTDFAANSRCGFGGVASNSDGLYFGMGVDGGIPAGFGFFRESSGWNTALAFYTNNVTAGVNSTAAMQEKMRIDSSGNVGIGVTAPANKLSVNVSGVGSITALNLTNDNSGFAVGTGPAINFGLSSITTGVFGKIEVLNQTASIGSNSYMAFSTRGGDSLAEKVRIDSSGNVGIGTTIPGYLLNVSKNGGGGGGAQLVRFTDTNTSNFIGPFHLTIGAASHTTQNPSPVLCGTGGIAFGVGDGSDLAAQRKMIIVDSGNVGIGTTNPLALLDINGSTGWVGGTTGNVANIKGANATTSQGGNLRVLSSSTIGIDLGGSLALGGQYTSGFYLDFAQIAGRKENATDGSATGYLAFATRGTGNTTERMRIDSSGNVGIGTSNPSQKLHVAGKIFAADGVSLGAAGGEGGEIGFQSASGTNAGMIDVDGGNTWRFYNALATPTVFYTNAIERMRIDASGRVTMPYQPRFMAYRSGHQTGYTGGTAVIFNNAAINVGNHYNATTGLFTAPVAGNYIFEVGIYMSAAVVQIWPLVNGGRVESILVTSLVDTNLTATTVRYLNANDTYCLVPYANAAAGLTIYDNGVHTYFRGSLIG